MRTPAAQPTFRHSDDGNLPSVWDQTIADAAVWHFADLAAFDRLVVVAPHPDDESLGAGATIASFASTGRAVTVVVCTNGDAAMGPNAPTDARALARRRSDELDDALDALAGAKVQLVRLELPDGRLGGYGDAMRNALGAVVGPGTLVVGPWIGDGHPDHRAASEACRATASEAGLSLVEYPVWAWHWGTPSVFDSEQLVRIPHAPSAHDRKSAAISSHRSQKAGTDPILSPRLLAHFDRHDEVFVVAHRGTVRPRHVDRSSEQFFDSMHTASPDGDPWGFLDRPEELHRLDDVVSSLGARRFGRGVEPGCSTGALTSRLAQRCDHLLASDIAASAVEAARRRLAGVDGVDFVHADAAATLRAIDAPVDLIVLSEVGYYLEPAQLTELAGLAGHHLERGATLLASHWTGSSEDHRLDASETHRIIAESLGRSPTRSIDRATYEIRIWERCP